jgi:glutamate-1-semialdehyde 2,1-aminomutase
LEIRIQQPTPQRGRRRCREVFAEAERVLVGGVNSPVRAFRSVGGDPLIVERGQGQFLFDADGNRLLDFVGSWGAMLLGHAHPAVVAAISEQAQKGTSYGVTTELEVELAERMVRAVPFLEKVRFVSSGTEATMSAVRLARGVTGRDLIVKFEGGYHGHADSFLSQAGSGLATLGIAECPGVPQALAQLTLNAPYNDLAAVERIFSSQPGKIAAVIVEPVAANMGLVPPAPGFLPGLREISAQHGALLIADEVITGFRLRNGSCQKMFGIEADLTTFGKIIGGGLPVAAYGGRAEIMDRVAPLGPVYQAGTLSGNPLAMRAGIATLDQLTKPGVYERLEKLSATFAAGIREIVRTRKIPAQVNALGSLATLFFSPEPVRDYAGAKKSDTTRYSDYFRNMLDRGVFLAPSQFEASFVSAAHTEADIDFALKAAGESLEQKPHS